MGEVKDGRVEEKWVQRRVDKGGKKMWLITYGTRLLFFSTKTISKNNTFLILLAAVPHKKGRTNCANT